MIIDNSEYFQIPELYRDYDVPTMYQSSMGDRYGMFKIPLEKSAGAYLKILAADGEETGWEHVSVTRWFGRNVSTPQWEDMALVKDLFWTPDACVVQFHPPHSDYVNNHDHCLHLWRKVGFKFPLPPSILVGHKSLNLPKP
jgi:hypothetical protein